jgi:DNA-binding MurR/RpiR family transcriptional regulator
LLRVAEQLAARRVFTILVTDEWISPVSRHARIVLPCRTSVDRTWDSSAALFVQAEAMIAQVTSLIWASASKRMSAADRLPGR